MVTVREPGGTEIGEQIRNIIVHNSKGDEMCPETELLLFAAARAQLVREVILPALMRGAIVLSDRYLDSSTVYQGIGRNLAADPVNQINRFAVGNVMPDLTIVIDVPTKVGLARIRQRASRPPEPDGAREHRLLQQDPRGLPAAGQGDAQALRRRRRAQGPRPRPREAIWEAVKPRIGG